jgi:hypothetical protein
MAIPSVKFLLYTLTPRLFYSAIFSISNISYYLFLFFLTLPAYVSPLITLIISEKKDHFKKKKKK